MKKSNWFLLFLFLLLSCHNFAANIDNEGEARLEDKYKNLRLLGKGSYGAVFQYANHAMKVSPMKDNYATLMNILEAALFNSLNHDTIPTPISVEIYRGKHANFLEVHLPYYAKLSENPLFVLKALSSLLSYLHGLNIAHRDIKPAHLLKNGDNLVLIDWGCADIFTADPIDWCGTTLNYRSPESLLGYTTYPKQNDMWSSGVSLLEIYRQGRLTFSGNDKATVLAKIEVLTRGEASTLAKLLSAIDLSGSEQPLRDLLNHDPQSRIAAHDLMNKLGGSNTFPALLPTPKPIISDRPQVSPSMRRMVYSWMHYLNIHLGLSDKVLFEAMSISDRFLEASTIDTKQFDLLALIALYLAAGFYDEYISIPQLISNAQNNYTISEFNDLLFYLLKKAQFRLIFRHTLRDYQTSLYGEFSPEERRIAKLLLTILEIDEKTYSQSNNEKWSLVSAVLAKDRDQENLAALHLIDQICRRFERNSLACPEDFLLLATTIERALGQ